MDVLSRGEPLGNAPGSGARAGAEAASIGPASLPAFGSRSVLRLPGLRPLRLSGREADGHQMLLRVLISIPRGHAVPLEALHLPLEPSLRLVEAPEPVLRVDIAVLRRLPVPLHGLLLVIDGALLITEELSKNKLLKIQ